MEPIFSQISQVALVVRNVDEVVHAFWDKYGIGPWKIFILDSNTVEDMIIRDKKENYKYKQATTYIGTTHFEIIEPLDDKSIYAEFLRKHGEGVHHIAFDTDHDKAMSVFRSYGKIEEQGGSISGKHKFTYVDCTDDLKMLVEFNKEEPGFQMPEPYAIYPEK